MDSASSRLRTTACAAALAACFAALSAPDGAMADSGDTSPRSKAAATATPSDLRRVGRRMPGASGVYVFDVTNDRMLLSRKAGRKRIIASNAKLFTAAAALDRHGADERFITSLWTDGTVENGELNGNLYLRGGGDPLFGGTDYVRRHFGSGATVEQLALSAAAVGLSRVTGRVYGDETLFDAYRGTATYGFRRSGDVGGQLGALIYNKGFNGSRYQADPPRFAAQRMRLALENVGVRVKNSTGVRPTPAGARILAYVESLPLSRLSLQMNKPSNNYLAEMLVKGLAMPREALHGGTGGDGGVAPANPAASGAADPVLFDAKPATTREGAGIARAFAATFGSRVKLGDGSGLSRTDRAAPREIVDLLRGMSTHTAYEPFDTSLPRPGIDGTLRPRMRNTEASRRCRAKTGTLSNVSALSGYCTTASGRLIAFSILNNNVWPPSARVAQDRIVTTIARLK